MKKYLLFVLALAFPFFVLSQQSITLTFTAIDSASYVELDSIKVMNRTQGGEIVLKNDSVLVLYPPPGLPEQISQKGGFEIKSFPNPITEHAILELVLPESGKTVLTATNALGCILYVLDKTLQAGLHNFKFKPGNAPVYFITVNWNGYAKTIKVINYCQNMDSYCKILYQRSDGVVAIEKATKPIKDFVFNIGDTLLYIGYSETHESGILDNPEGDQDYIFQFATNIPCPGTPTVDYEGQVYNTIQIFSQCWLKENLNIGTMIQGTEEMTDNDTIEKYCYNNEPDSCTKYGGLYQWWEMMQYTTQRGTRGICPPGWHIPTDEECKVLEGAVDIQYGIGNSTWDIGEFRGYDAGSNLKTTSGWIENGNGTDLFGFSGLPGGYRGIDGDFSYVGSRGYWWTSTEYDTYNAWGRLLYYGYPEVYRDYVSKWYGFSVRCLRDY